ncbi:hypothetical protein, partial [Fontibacter flavus]|uniref:hypothetical protein n=1 Tax=Fontibacter flavus TaxID=654838 RepID=UPI0036D3C728
MTVLLWERFLSKLNRPERPGYQRDGWRSSRKMEAGAHRDLFYHKEHHVPRRKSEKGRGFLSNSGILIRT